MWSAASAHATNSLSSVIRRLEREAGSTIAAIDTINVDCDAHEFCVLPFTLTYGELAAATRRLGRALSAYLFSQCPLTRADTNDVDENPITLASLMSRGNDWYCLFLTAATLHVPMVSLSQDLADEKAEQERNAEILATLHPALLVTSEAKVRSNGTAVVTFADLWAFGQSEEALTSQLSMPQEPSADDILCFCFTGGTTKASRCAKVTHRMALHEVAVYPSIAQLAHTDRVLQQHSVYWGASAYGELDIALAFGCALVFCKASSPEEVASVIQRHDVSCAGLVPSVLAAMRPCELPSLKLVFTWGEALRVRTAREWAADTCLVDLLISTECWLSLYAKWPRSCASGERPIFRAVPQAQVRLRNLEHDLPLEDSSADKVAAGELLITGPMVSPGYVKHSQNAAAFVAGARVGQQWYCTRDCVEKRGDGFAFTGRADDLVKVGGMWVDSGRIEQRLAEIEEVAEACVSGRHAWVVLRKISADTAAAIRRLLPPDFQLGVLQSLPRSAATGKVDRRALNAIANTALVIPMESQEKQLSRDELKRIQLWYRPLGLLGVAAGLHAIHRLVPHVMQFLEVPSVSAASMNSDVWAILPRFGLHFAWQLSWRFTCCSYMILSTWHMPADHFKAINQHCPFGIQSSIAAITAVLPSPLWGASLAAPGMYLAAKRRRLLSWPLVCGVGFPVWARDNGSWWVSHRGTNIARWYWQHACVKPVKSGVKAGCSRGVDAVWRLGKCVKLVQICAHCKKRCMCSGGSSDPKDKNWYCNACWDYYHKFEQCVQCQAWSAECQQGDRGLLCRRCMKALKQKRQLDQQKQDTRSSSPDRELQPEVLKQEVPLHPSEKDQEPLKQAGRSSSPDQDSQPEILKQDASPKLIEKDPGQSKQETRSNSPNQESQPEMLKQKSVPERDVETIPEVPPIPPELENQTKQPPGKAPAVVKHRTLALDGIEGSLPLSKSCATASELGSASVESSACCNADAGATRRSAEWQLIERATGWQFPSPDSTLAGLDSLRMTKLVSAVSRELGRRLPHAAVRRSATLANLIDEIRRLHPETNSLNAAHVEPSSKEWATWGIFWNGRCTWTLRRNRPLSEKTLRAALVDLIDRHQALRAKLCDPLRLYGGTQKAFTVFEMWRAHSENVVPRWALVPGLARLLSQSVRWGFRHSWPRACGNLPTDPLPLFVAKHSTSEAEAAKALWRSPRFTPPFQVTLATYDAPETEEQALVLIQVTHMFSDGYSIVPILADLSHFVARAEGALEAAPLPALPNSFATFEQRLLRTIFDDDSWRDAITLDSVTKSSAWYDPETVFLKIPEAVISAIRQTGRNLGVSDDVIVLTAIGVALARLFNDASVPIELVVPQRDGIAESDMVGLLADIRHLNICTAELSFAGVAMQLQHIVKERLWSRPGISTQYRATFVNFEWTDFEMRHGFSQVVELGDRGERLLNPMKIAVDQPDAKTWRMRITFDKRVHKAHARDQFFEDLTEGFKKLAVDPLSPVWPKPITGEEVVGSAGAVTASSEAKQVQSVEIPKVQQ